MIKKIFPCLLVCLAVSACNKQSASLNTQDKREKSVINYDAKSDSRVKSDSTMQLILESLPPVKDKRMLNMLVNYRSIAEGWWIEKRCKTLSRVALDDFEKRTGIFTQLAQMLMVADFGPEEDPNMPYTQRVQMYSLNAASANKFYNCSDVASKKVSNAYAISKKATEGMKLVPSK